ncbi:MarR family transcriptional regulator [Burkholderia thailandensis]|uniref:MarR family transcriptional regulator n=1 Tax=Burkholderia thailandensis TaxID=57975 RepID=A0AAW9CTD4_BURTH|nr:MarR family transcriptional regulator [Burkholderia thailandensis]AHI67636.1 hypothetical protein BTL_5624 [Burkholderia thailandensis H0587]MCS3392864.1 MarR family transcriptional regulator [Burkholderia thailandensis]MCS6425664.1 MarR family transcriptional regulator [Burkholderia thailandensis]MCS6453314.1 MarR family transcriptional regulator [Burkholderia thailandensis]MCS6464922.1 MarR family transcriptional regulator [Burkholderia thailandensis]
MQAEHDDGRAELADRIEAALDLLNAESRRRVRNAAAKAGISAIQLEALNAIHQHREPMSVGQLSARMRISYGNAYLITNGMTHRRLLNRIGGGSGKRGITFVVSHCGRELVTRAHVQSLTRQAILQLPGHDMQLVNRGLQHIVRVCEEIEAQQQGQPDVDDARDDTISS